MVTGWYALICVNVGEDVGLLFVVPYEFLLSVAVEDFVVPSRRSFPTSHFPSKMVINDGLGKTSRIAFNVDFFPVGSIHEMIPVKRYQRRDVARGPAQRQLRAVRDQNHFCVWLVKVRAELKSTCARLDLLCAGRCYARLKGFIPQPERDGGNVITDGRGCRRVDIAEHDNGHLLTRY